MIARRFSPLALAAIGMLASVTAFAQGTPRTIADSSDTGARAVPAGKEANKKAVEQAVADALNSTPPNYG